MPNLNLQIDKELDKKIKDESMENGFSSKLDFIVKILKERYAKEKE